MSKKVNMARTLFSPETCLIFAFVGGLILFSPSSGFADSSEAHSKIINSEKVVLSYSAQLFAMIPMMIDLLMDIPDKKGKPELRATWISRAVVVGVHLICSAYAFSSSRTQSLKSGLFLCSTAAMVFSSFGAIFYCLGYVGKRIWTIRRTLTIQLFFFVSLMLGLFTNRNDLDAKYRIISGALLAISALGVFFLSVIWILDLFAEKIFPRKATSMEERCSTIISVAFIGSFISLSVVGPMNRSSGAHSMLDLTDEGLSAIIYISTVFTIMVCVLPGKITRAESFALRDVMIESKMSSLRNASHKLRRPLDRVFLGVKRAKERIGSSPDLDDAASNCEIALRIVNELLCYDHLESGSWEPKVTEVNALSFLREASQPMVAQACEHRVDLRLMYEEASHGFHVSHAVLDDRDRPLVAADEATDMTLSSPNLRHDDFMFIDTKKISHVLDVLISYSVSWVSAGGTVVVKPRYVPGDSSLPKLKLGGNKEAKKAPRAGPIKERKPPMSMTQRVLDVFRSHESWADGVIAPISSSKVADSSKIAVVGWLVIDISNNGMGMDSSELAGVFAKKRAPAVESSSEHEDNRNLTTGARASKGRHRRGSIDGILSPHLAKVIVEMHGGSVTVTSEGQGDGKGFTISIELPMYRKLYSQDASDIEAGFMAPGGRNSSSHDIPIHSRRSVSSALMNFVDRRIGHFDSLGVMRGGMSSGGAGVGHSLDIGLGPGSGASSSAAHFAMRSVLEIIREDREQANVSGDFNSTHSCESPSHAIVRHASMTASANRRSEATGSGNGATIVPAKVPAFEPSGRNSQSPPLNGYPPPAASSASLSAALHRPFFLPDTHFGFAASPPSHVRSGRHPPIPASFLAASPEVSGTGELNGRDRAPDSRGRRSPHQLAGTDSRRARKSRSGRKLSSGADRGNNNNSVHEEELRFEKVYPDGEAGLMKTRSPSRGPSVRFNESTSVKAFKLLVVDDSIVDRRLLCNELVDLGHLCEEAKDGLEALARIAASCPINADGTTSPPTEGRTDEYDAILMDFDMPNMDGPTATRELREMGFKGVIFGMVGKAVPKDIEKFKESGVSKVFTKPLNVDVFVQTMNTIAK